ncbi:hypothetical protein PVAP13_5NG107362 [Panicum virgatum]|uniref:Uncharacterized protein n=1 Tax=Panicum virgatum TaxID=38727 RepID=A0A8T0RL21_PANVG|nr:hypothetical protein PVAP13_5NG107362 [Panicum virgatum]
MLATADMGFTAGEVVHHRVRHDGLHEPFAASAGRRFLFHRLPQPGRWEKLHLLVHPGTTGRTCRVASVRHVIAAAPAATGVLVVVVCVNTATSKEFVWTGRGGLPAPASRRGSSQCWLTARARWGGEGTPWKRRTGRRRRRASQCWRRGCRRSRPWTPPRAA